MISPQLLTPRAQSDLDALIADSKRRFGSNTVEKFLARMANAFEIIERNPTLYRVRPTSSGKTYRSCVVDPFVICYGVIDKRPNVFAIMHGARDLNSLIEKRLY